MAHQFKSTETELQSNRGELPDAFRGSTSRSPAERQVEAAYAARRLYTQKEAKVSGYATRRFTGPRSELRRSELPYSTVRDTKEN